MIAFRTAFAAIPAVLFSLHVSAEEAPKDDAAIAAIKKHAELCAEAQLKPDPETFISYIPPKLLGFMGGPEGVKRMVTEQMAELKRRGVTFESVKIGTPEPPKEHGGVLAGLVPMEMVLATPQGKLSTKSHLIAISEDKGAKWMFVDSVSINDEKLAILYPSLEGKLVIPETVTTAIE